MTILNKKSGWPFILLFVLLSFGLSSWHTDPKPESTEEFVSRILKTMTLEDKVGEMTQLAIDVLSVGSPYNLQEPHTFDSSKLHNVLVDLKVGSILNVGGHAYHREDWEKIIRTIQTYATTKKKSGIPVLYGIDAIHGTNYTQHATLFPQQLGQAATWNIDIAQACGEVTAYETRASGIPWSFSPVLDIGRDPRWPRLWETYGEDVHLASELGTAYIKGMQGKDASAKYNVATCMKHFLGYSVTLRGKDRTQAWVPERQLKEYFTPTFKAAIDAGALTIMINSGEMNGIPVHADPKILKDLLRDELGFKGLAVTDWEDIGYLVSRHRVAHDFKEAIAIAINAGIDLAMVPMDTSFPTLLKELVEEGKVPMSRIDESVRRILAVKKELGLFENAYYDFADYSKFGGESHRLIAQKAAEESIILAKNKGNLLPLSSDTKIYITGPNADKLNVLNGGWTGTWQGADEKYDTPGKSTLRMALTDKFEGNIVQEASDADVIVLCIGEKPYTEKPGDIDDINLDPEQIELVENYSLYQKPIALLITEGRPRIISKIEPLADAVLVGFLPGNEGGLAFANIMSGEVNPSAKFPITYPKYSNDLLTYDHKGTDLVHRDFSMNGFNPQYEFGFGLSYSNFEYKNLTVTSKNDQILVTVDVSNTSDIDGKEVIQLYVCDKVASITPSVKRLRAFEKRLIKAGTTENITFTLHKDDLKFVGYDNEWIFESGHFTFQVASLSETIKL